MSVETAALFFLKNGIGIREQFFIMYNALCIHTIHIKTPYNYFDIFVRVVI